MVKKKAIKKQNKKSIKKQNKADRIKEIIIKCLIILGLVFGFGGVVIIPLILMSLRNPYFDEIAFIIEFASLGASMICIIVIFILGNSIKTANPKDYKIMKYNCGFEGSLKERFIKVFGDTINTIDNSDLIYTYYAKGESVKEVVLTVYYPIDEFFNEDDYTDKIGQIPEVYGDYFAHTMNVIFEETSNSKYLYEIMHSPKYGTATDRVFFSVYNSETKILSVNKTKDPTGVNTTYFTAKRELDKIFNFQTKKKTNK